MQPARKNAAFDSGECKNSVSDRSAQYLQNSATADLSDGECLADSQQIPDVSIIIPVYNEQERIAATLYTTKDYLESSNLSFEVVVVDDGSNDMTAEIVKFVDLYGNEVKSQQLGHLEENVKNIGKGYSIAKGMLKATGRVVVFTDADSATPIYELTKLLAKIEEGYDVVVGSRNHPESDVSGRSFLRNALSRGFNMLGRGLGVITVRDSQCGFKAYRCEVAHQVAELQQTYGFCFDVEHLYIAKRLGYRITEVPVQWSHQAGSTLSLFKDSMLMFLDLVRIRWIHRDTHAAPDREKRTI